MVCDFIHPSTNNITYNLIQYLRFRQNYSMEILKKKGSCSYTEYAKNYNPDFERKLNSEILRLFI